MADRVPVGGGASEGFVVLANQAAGSVQERSLGDAVRELAQHGPTELHMTSGADDLDRELRDLGNRRPVVVGGDGSLHLAVNRMRVLGLSDVPVGLVPLGTGNDLARGLRLSLDPAEAARVVATGRAQPLPVATHDGSAEVVVNNVHTGLGERAARLGTGLKPRLGALAYPAGALLAGARPDVATVEVRVDGRSVHQGPALAVVVALGPSAGGGHEVAPGADPTEPQLDVVLVAASSLRARLSVGAAIMAGRDPAERPGVHRWSGRRIEILHGGAVTPPWDLDGEIRRWSSPVGLTVEPAAWWLVR
jgi:diacylglycerol kinase family enzyme